MKIQEKTPNVASGYLALVVLPILTLLFGWLFIRYAPTGAVVFSVLYMAGFLITMICYKGFFMVHPNQAKVLQLFGTYVGSVRQTGLRWANPFYSKEPVSLRVRNFESGQMKVNDSSGNPVDIAAVVVWKVVDSAEAMFEVDDYESFVQIQSEAALRNMATSYPYEAHEGEEIALRSHPQAIAEKLREEVQDRLDTAGVEVIEARISHLAYAPEIAAAMLRRQQAGAIIAARTKIVEGAVGMVEMALDLLSRSNRVRLDEERRAQLVSNLLVVLCSDQEAQPVINAGTIYQ